MEFWALIYMLQIKATVTSNKKKTNPKNKNSDTMNAVQLLNPELGWD